MQGHAAAVVVVCVAAAIAVTVAAAVRARKFLASPALTRHSIFERTHFRSGDLLLWSTPPGATWYNDIQKLLCGSPYTHASIVFVDAAHVPWAWESVPPTGHRLVRLRTLLADRPCTLRKINTPLDSAALERFIRENIGSNYSYSMWEAVMHQWLPVGTAASASAARPAAAACQRRRRRFCSQLVVDTYDALGALSLALSAKADSALVLPADLAFPRDRAVLHWLAPYALGPEIHVTLHCTTTTDDDDDAD